MAQKEEKPKKGGMTVAEAGKRGGDTTSSRYGHEFYENIGKKGGETTSEKYGAPFYEEIGAKGGRTTSKKYGHEFYEDIGHKGGQKVKALIAAGREQEKKDKGGK